MSITPRPGHTLTELEASADSIIDRFKREGPTADEMSRALAGSEFGFVSALESNLGKAEILNAGAAFHGDPGYFKTAYAKLKAVTAADVQRVAVEVPRRRPRGAEHRAAGQAGTRPRTPTAAPRSRSRRTAATTSWRPGDAPRTC